MVDILKEDEYKRESMLFEFACSTPTPLSIDSVLPNSSHLIPQSVAPWGFPIMAPQTILVLCPLHWSKVCSLPLETCSALT